MKQNIILQSITTKFLPATNTRGSRVKAVAASGKQLLMAYDHGLNSDENHFQVARTLAEKLGWMDGGFELVAGGYDKGMHCILIHREDMAAILKGEK